jgi:tetraprenyl-beta-curcumene synthase
MWRQSSLNNQELSRKVPRSPVGLMSRVYKFILPEVRIELEKWRREAEQIPDEELRKQALASIDNKRFHCQGGAVYAAANLPEKHILIPLIVAYQTISDYLDNLCDRSTSLDPADFRQLHQSMLDAVTPETEPADYYALRTEREDGGYLLRLVQKCRDCIGQLSGYEAAKPYIRDLAGLYTDLQVYKHIHPDKREAALLEWWSLHAHRTPQPWVCSCYSWLQPIRFWMTKMLRPFMRLIFRMYAVSTLCWIILLIKTKTGWAAI